MIHPRWRKIHTLLIRRPGSHIKQGDPGKNFQAVPFSSFNSFSTENFFRKDFSKTHSYHRTTIEQQSTMIRTALDWFFLGRRISSFTQGTVENVDTDTHSQRIAYLARVVLALNSCCEKMERRSRELRGGGGMNEYPLPSVVPARPDTAVYRVSCRGTVVNSSRGTSAQ